MFFKISFLLVFVAVCFRIPTGSADSQVLISPVTAIKEVGEAAIILCRLEDEPLMFCSFKIPQGEGKHKKFLVVQGSNDSAYTYYGNGLEKGECGVTLTVEEKYNGIFICELTRKNGETLEATTKLIVAKKPQRPVLRLDSEVYVEGRDATATCAVAGGRPAAHLTWAFDGREDFDSLIKQQNGRTLEVVNDTTTVTERAVWTINAEDDQKTVSCSATHHSWRTQGPELVNRTITVHYKPRIYNEQNEVQEDILYANLVLGEPATVVIKLRSNPAPSGVEITIANTTLTVGAGDEKYQLSEPKQENGFYLYSLIIKNLTKADLNHVGSVAVTNAVGSSVAKVTFGTLPSTDTTAAPSTEKPKGRAIAGNTWTGIVIAVCIIIIVVAGLMFAKFNKKWCFASTSKPVVHTGQLVSSE